MAVMRADAKWDTSRLAVALACCRARNSRMDGRPMATMSARTASVTDISTSVKPDVRLHAPA